jgi:hypothetical protein
MKGIPAKDALSFSHAYRVEQTGCSFCRAFNLSQDYLIIKKSGGELFWMRIAAISWSQKSMFLPEGVISNSLRNISYPSDQVLAPAHA